MYIKLRYKKDDIVKSKGDGYNLNEKYGAILNFKYKV